ncbi:MAG: cobaltochelatase subunit CobT [Parvularcula sp.]
MSSQSDSPSDLFKRLLCQTTKAMAATPEAEIGFGGDAPLVMGHDAKIPLPPRRLNQKRVAVSRGHGDAAALRLAHHDPLLFAEATPHNEAAREVFAALEQARLDAIGTNALGGVGNNLEAALARRLEENGYARLEDKDDIPLTDVLHLLSREAMTGRKPPKAAAHLVDLWREDIMASAGDDLKALAAPGTLMDQKSFSELAIKLIDSLGLGDADTESSSDEAESEQTDNEENQPEDDSDDAQDTDADDTDQEETPDFGEMSSEDMEMAEDTASVEDADDKMDGEAPEAAMRQNERHPDSLETYKAFTTEFDEVAGAEDFADSAELERLRQTLDAQLEPLQAVVSRLANRLHRRLLAQQNRAWQFDLDEGTLDAARLARIVADPMQPLSYKQEKDQEFRDTTVSLLIDNSGSMRGRPIAVAAICADILARTLERCGVKVEVLGFTTKAWKGGKSREAWVDAGRPRNPGRLNDLRHIIYKPASIPWRRSKNNLGLMLKEGLLKENIDGEALLWAHNRLLGRPEHRRILMVISDGAPVDDSTSSTNGGGYLDRHLRDVIAYIQSASPIELLAIGIGHDVTRFYDRALTIHDVDQLGGAITEQLAELFETTDPDAPLRRRA